MTIQANIHWPAFIQYSGDPDLEYLHDQTAWHDWSSGPSNARLIDAEGTAYQILPTKILNQHEQLTLVDILSLIRLHAAQEGICCTTKIGAPSIPAAIQLLATLTEN